MLMQLVFLFVYTLVIIALLKRSGWITVHPQNVRDNQFRSFFLMALQLGDLIVAKSMDLVGAVYARRGGLGRFGSFGRGGFGGPGYGGPGNAYEQRIRREEPPYQREEPPYRREEPAYPYSQRD